MRGEPLSWLRPNIRVYLTGFLKCRIRPKTRKDSQKVAGEKYEIRVFTIRALTMIRSYANRYNLNRPL